MVVLGGWMFLLGEVPMYYTSDVGRVLRGMKMVKAPWGTFGIQLY